MSYWEPSKALCHFSLPCSILILPLPVVSSVILHLLCTLDKLARILQDSDQISSTLWSWLITLLLFLLGPPILVPVSLCWHYMMTCLASPHPQMSSLKSDNLILLIVHAQCPVHGWKIYGTYVSTVQFCICIRYYKSIQTPFLLRLGIGP